ncbi:hypothetical protein HK100_006759 [Physocladia obscura]|uniref:SANT domain-containing protein n=1 Tax=Physocladia obscura TaxID=109957 RepID=A0AAD5T6W2_9FUNG|nr:hypothetical protein HK100_006759 [Physocladia obscura]
MDDLDVGDLNDGSDLFDSFYSSTGSDSKRKAVERVVDELIANPAKFARGETDDVISNNDVSATAAAVAVVSGGDIGSGGSGSSDNLNNHQTGIENEDVFAPAEEAEIHKALDGILADLNDTPQSATAESEEIQNIIANIPRQQQQQTIPPKKISISIIPNNMDANDGDDDDDIVSSMASSVADDEELVSSQPQGNNNSRPSLLDHPTSPTKLKLIVPGGGGSNGGQPHADANRQQTPNKNNGSGAGNSASSVTTPGDANRGNSARRADPLQHQNHARAGITIAAAYASGSCPAYSKNSNRPYISEKMSADIPQLLTKHQLSQSAASRMFSTTQPLPLEFCALLQDSRIIDPKTTTVNSIPISPVNSGISLEGKMPITAATRHVEKYLTTVDVTTGPLPDAVLEAILVPKDVWTPAEFDALDKGLEACGKNFTRISRDYVQSRSTFECIHAYYTRKYELRSVRVRKYKKRVGKEDEEYVKYVTGLSKYIVMETKRMKAEKMGKSVNGFSLANAVKIGNEIKGLMGPVKDISENGVSISAAAAAMDDGSRGVRTRRSAAI